MKSKTEKHPTMGTDYNKNIYGDGHLLAPMMCHTQVRLCKYLQRHRMGGIT